MGDSKLNSLFAGADHSPDTTGYPNRLSAPRPLPDAEQPAGRLLVLLFLLCLTPRIIMALSLDVMCPDGAFFVECAQHLSDGNGAPLPGNYDLNVYPLVLATVHHLGFDWENAGKTWGVLCASLVVLPLFGWIRRMFDQRVAVVSCLLYAVHPKLIEWSPELVRESTFWLFFTCAIYGMWRAVTEVRPLWFGFSGIATALAVHTRFEGWFLFLILGLWSLWRLLALAHERRWLVTGVAIHLLCLPLVLVALMSAYGHSRWHWGSFHRLQMVTCWLGITDAPTTGPPTLDVPPKPSAADPPAVESTHPPTENPPVAATVAATTPAPHPPPRSAPNAESKTTSEVLWDLLHTLERGFTPLFGGLMVIGHLFIWRMWLRRDVQPLFYWCLVTIAGMWVHLWASQESSSRYAMAMVLLSIAVCVDRHSAIGRFGGPRGRPHQRQGSAAAASRSRRGVVGGDDDRGLGRRLHQQVPRSPGPRRTRRMDPGGVRARSCDRGFQPLEIHQLLRAGSVLRHSLDGLG